jgi:hypothetical protein
MAAFLRRALDDGSFVPPTVASFADVPVTHPFFADIEWMVAEGITTGYSDDTFRPGGPLSRQGMAAFLRRALG